MDTLCFPEIKCYKQTEKTTLIVQGTVIITAFHLVIVKKTGELENRDVNTDR